jgi:glutathione S-transferase
MDPREQHHVDSINELESQLRPVEREAERLRDLIKKYKKELEKRLQEGPAMREAGLTYADIGAAWGIGADRAREIVQRAERIKAFREHNGPPEAP